MRSSLGRVRPIGLSSGTGKNYIPETVNKKYREDHTKDIKSTNDIKSTGQMPGRPGFFRGASRFSLRAHQRALSFARSFRCRRYPSAREHAVHRRHRQSGVPAADSTLTNCSFIPSQLFFYRTLPFLRLRPAPQLLCEKWGVVKTQRKQHQAVIVRWEGRREGRRRRGISITRAQLVSGHRFAREASNARREHRPRPHQMSLRRGAWRGRRGACSRRSGRSSAPRGRASAPAAPSSAGRACAAR